MDFSAKRLALLAGVGDSEDRHEIVREYAQQLNESAEARQLNEDEEAVRKAVRRTIQKMIAEGSIDAQEEMHEEVVNEEEDHEAPSKEDLERMRKSLEAAEAEAKRREEEKAKQKASQNESINEADATLMRLQKLAGVQILSEGYTDDNLTEARDEDLDEDHCVSEEEDPMEERVVMPPTDGGPDPDSMAYEEEAHDEAKLYELEDGRMYMEMGGRRYMMQEMEEELNELDEELREPEEGEMIDTASGQAVKLSTPE